MIYKCTGCGNESGKENFYSYKNEKGETRMRKRCKFCTIDKVLEARARRMKKGKKK